MMQAPLNALNRLAGSASKPPKQKTASLIRPANTTDYAVGDAIFGDPPTGAAPKALVFPDVTYEPGGAGYIVTATLIDLANQPTKLNADLLLFNAEPEAAPVDNAPYAATANYMDHFVGIISFSNSLAKVAGGCSMYSVGVNQAFECVPDSSKLFGILVAQNAYTPISSEKLIVKLNIVGRGMALL